MKTKLKSIIMAYHMAVGHRVAAAMVCALCAVGLAAGAESSVPQVKNVTFAQRYPWNGLVDISFDLAGAGKVALNVTALTNGVPLCEAKSITGEMVIDLGESGSETNGVKLVWNAADDLPADFMSSSVKIDVTAKKFVPKKHTVDVTLKSQSSAPVAGKVYFWLGGESTEISIEADGTGSGEVPEGKGTWTVAAQYCATTPTTPTESTIDQDGMAIDLTVQRQTTNVNVVALWNNKFPSPPVTNATITAYLYDDYDWGYGEPIEATTDDDGKAQLKDVELGLYLEVYGEGIIWDPTYDDMGKIGHWWELECDGFSIGPDKIIKDGEKQIPFVNKGGV